MKPVEFRFATSKDGNSLEEYEDSSYMRSKDPSKDYGMYWYAVTDGATESAFAKEWAWKLAKAYCKDKLCHKGVFTHYLQKVQETWKKDIDARENSLPWYALEKAHSGAFSSLVGLKIYGQRTWESIAVGDSCLFQVRQNQLITRFPIEHSKEFNNHPFLISSINSKNSQLVQHTQFFENTWKIGDSFYLMTDALSCWFLEEYEKGNRPWLILNDLNNFQKYDSLVNKLRKRQRYEGDFKEKINNLRSNKQIRNDDFTLIMITLER
jgi:serine/threonine protein phosphatase PrpC